MRGCGSEYFLPASPQMTRQNKLQCGPFRPRQAQTFPVSGNSPLDGRLMSGREGALLSEVNADLCSPVSCSLAQESGGVKLRGDLPVCGARRVRPAVALAAPEAVPSNRWQQRYFRRIAKPIASTPNGLDIVFAACRLCQLFSQMADKNIDDPAPRLGLSPVEVTKKHLLGHGGALLQAEHL